MEIFGFSVAVLFYAAILGAPIFVVSVLLIKHMVNKVTGSKAVAKEVGAFLLYREYGTDIRTIFRRIVLPDGLWVIILILGSVTWFVGAVISCEKGLTLLEMFIEISSLSTPFFVYAGAGGVLYLGVIFVGRQGFRLHQAVAALTDAQEDKENDS